jgi:hypothetical protein
MAEEQGKKLIPRTIGNRDCEEPIITGQPSTRYDYIPKYHNEDTDDIPKDLELDLCDPWYYYNTRIGDLQVDANVAAGGEVTSNGGSHILSNKKNLPFDMPHPNKPGWRLRHVCIEGPEIAVYCRGKVPPDGIIELPSYWKGLVNPEDMTINVTPHGCWQELYINKIEWGQKIIVRNNAGGPIDADYHIIARRKDDDLIVEYEGKTHEDYPNGNESYSFNFEHNYVKKLIQDTVRDYLKENLDKDLGT